MEIAKGLTDVFHNNNKATNVNFACINVTERLQLTSVCLMCRLREEGGVAGVNIYPTEERAQHSAGATDDFKMSFSSSLPCNSAAALKKNKYQHLNHSRLKHSETLTTAKCHRNKEDTSDIYRIIQSPFMTNDFMKKNYLYWRMISLIVS